MAQAITAITFGPFRLDPYGARLWKDDQPVPLQPRPLAVLCYLATRPGVVVGRDELLRTLWAGTVVTRAVLKVAVRAIREALGDDADAPRFLETVGRDGYRFIGLDPVAARPRSGGPVPEATPIVGRAGDLAILHGTFARAAAGSRRIVLVTGEAGIGKTTLIERFVAEVARGGTAAAWGQCLEQYGEGEAYLPVLEALGNLARGAAGAELSAVLRRHAPTWTSQLPGLAGEGRVAPRAGTTIAAVPARMLREIADALEVFTRDQPLVLVLEDLQWSDPSTVDLLACLARRRGPARLMVIGSLRPADVIVHDHPLRAVRRELRAIGCCEEVALELLSMADVAAYLGARFAAGFPGEMRRLASWVHARTDGNALFMVNVVNDLVTRGVLARRDGRWRVVGPVETLPDRVPTGLRDLIARRLESLAPAVRRVLEVASVAGEEFAVAAVAAALAEDPEAVEEACETSAAQGALIAEAGVAEWPDGSVSGRYRFLHALYRHVLYEGVGAARRVRLHRAIGLREEVAFGPRAAERAAELAMHFTRGRDDARALRYHELSARAALDRHASQEAVAHLDAALVALARIPAAPDLAERERSLVVASATLLMSTRGYAAPETEQAFARARVLCDAAPATPELYSVLRGLVSYHHVRAELAEAARLGEVLLAHAADHPEDRALSVQAHYGHGATLFHTAAFAGARGHLEAALRDYDPATHREHVLVYGGYDPGVACSLWLAWTLALLGRLDEAVTLDRAGLALAERAGDAFTLAWARHAAGVTQQVFGDWAASEAASAEAARLAEEHGFPHVLGMATVNRGWALVMQGKPDLGIPVLRDGVAAVEATGAALLRPSYLGMLAAADAIEGNRRSALGRLDEGLAEVERTGERLHEGALLIAKSRLLAAGSDGRAVRTGADAAEACLRRALEVGRAQGAVLIALRAALALARHCEKRGRVAEARALLAAALAPFAAVRAVTPEVVAARRLVGQWRAS
ncbi:MAG TPA: AAA family ATPase [Candidatus Binatia bacterium]|nr:AAA family ATPase [Candidatus Binatia bacterium]